MSGARMIVSRTTTTAVAVLTALLTTPVPAQDYRVLRYGNTSPWSFDGRDDRRDFSTNGFFPGNFTTRPSDAWIGAAGLLGSNPQRSAQPYPSQVVFRRSPHSPSCARHHRLSDQTPGTQIGDARRRC
jgi:hypothetical protein